MDESNEAEHGLSRDSTLMAELEKHLGKQTATVLAALLDAEIERVEQTAFLKGFKTAAQWIAGPKWAGITIAILTGSLEKSDRTLAVEMGASRAAVGKYVRRLRANAGLSLRVPQRSHGEETRQGIAAAKKEKQKTASASAGDLVKSKEAA